MEGENHYKKGLWTEDEDRDLLDYIKVHGRGQWNRIPKMTGLKRGGKSCRLRWMNYLSPNVKRGHFSEEEDDIIIRMHNLVGNRWSLIAGRVPGRTDNQVKNHWNTHLCKKHGVKKEIGKVVGSSITHFPQVFNHPRQDDTNPNKHISFNTTSAAAVGCATNQDPSTVNGIEAYSEQAQWLGKHNFESIWFTNDYLNPTSPGLVELVDAYHLNSSWENL